LAQPALELLPLLSLVCQFQDAQRDLAARLMPANPTNPVPSSSRHEGSGVIEGGGADTGTPSS
jgi:hypothetical protein